MVEGARLESVYTAKPYRGFESLPLRHSVRESFSDRQHCPAKCAEEKQIVPNGLTATVRGGVLCPGRSSLGNDESVQAIIREDGSLSDSKAVAGCLLQAAEQPEQLAALFG